MATNDKYDRQLRLWGALGQKRLMESKILLIGADSVGTEALKNLVLPGIGSFTILDDFVINYNDLGNNFFADENSLGKPRAEVIAEFLCEMNPDVQGFARVANFSNLFLTEPSFFNQFSLIITSNLSEAQYLPFAEYCWQHQINLILLRSYGLIGYLRLQLPNHLVLDSKEDNDQFNLRLFDPFPELSQFCESFCLESLDSLEHSHVPYVVLLYKALFAWKESHNQLLPSNFTQKEAFKTTLKEMSRDINNQINFQEALKESFRIYQRKGLSPELLEAIEQQRDQLLTPQTSNFTFLLRALDEFMKRNNQEIPVNGSIPDMTATTDYYIRLQQVYQQKAHHDLNEFKIILRELVEMAGVSVNKISNDEIESFCKHASSILPLKTHSLHEEIQTKTAKESLIETLTCDLYDDPLQTPIIWYLALRAIDAFHLRFARWPGNKPETLTSDQRELYRDMIHLCQEYDLPSNLYDSLDSLQALDSMDTESNGEQVIRMAHAQEMTRFGAGELHTISSIIGGIAAQEAVKIITQQYVPFNNTYIYNGIASCGAAYNL